MEIIFKNSKTEKLINSDKELNKKYPVKVAKTVKLRMTQLIAFNDFSQVTHLPPLRLHKLTGDRSHQYAVDVSEKYRLVFEILDEEGLAIKDPEYPRNLVHIIKIIEVVNYHV